MNKWGKRLLSLLLAASMMIPTTTFALDDEVVEEPSEEPEVAEEQTETPEETPTDETSEEEEEVEIEIEANAAKADVERVLPETPEGTQLGNDGPLNTYHDVRPDKELKPTKSAYAANKGELPSSYSLVDQGRVTAVKNQNPYGTCWTFATIASAESSAITQGIANTNLDLAELGVAYFVYNRPSDPLGLTEDDETNVSNSLNLDTGGNVWLASMLYAGGLGFIDENDLPYSDAASVANGTYTPDDLLGYLNNHVVTNGVIWLDLSEMDAVKSVLMEKGAMAISYYHDDECYYEDEASYYCPEDMGTNHAVTLVGWDDNYSKDNFYPYKPSSDGAWLVRNSWASDWGDNGYFWLSYEDYNAMNYSMAIQINVEEDDHNTTIYQYDGTASAEVAQMNTEHMYEANVFTAVEFGELKRVGFYTIDDSITECNIYVYKNVEDGNPMSGTEVARIENYQVEYAGYHTVDLQDGNVGLAAGEKFSVVVETWNNSGAHAYMVDTTANYRWISMVSSSEEGQSYVSVDGANWSDISASGDTNLRIKAYTAPGKLIEDLTLLVKDGQNEFNVGETSEIQVAFYPVDSLEPIQYYLTNSDGSWGWIDLHEDGTFEATEPGEVTVHAYTSQCADSITLTILSPITDLELEENELTFGHIGTTKSIYANVVPWDTTDDDTLTYTSSNTDVATVDSWGEVTSVGLGTATITVETTTGITKEVTVYVVENPYETATPNIPQIVDTYTTYNMNMLHFSYDEFLDGIEIYRSTDGKKYTYDSYVTFDVGSYGESVTFNKTYYYKLKGYYTRADGETVYSEFSEPVKLKNTVAAPSVYVDDYSSGNKLEWNKVTGASGYEIYRATSENGKYTKIKTLSSKYTSFKDTGLTPMKTYYYKMRAYRTVGKTKVYSRYSSIKSNVAAPAKVSGLAASATYDGFKLTWKAAKGANIYVVEMQYPGDPDWYAIATPTTNSYTVKSLAFNKTYKFRVTSANVNEEAEEYHIGTTSASISAKTALAKANVTVSKFGIGALTVKWDKVKGAEGYQVQMKKGSKGKWTTVSSDQTAKTFTQYKLSVGTTYYYRVRSYRYDENGTKVYSAWSSTKSKKVTGATFEKHKMPYTFSSYYGYNYMKVSGYSAKVLRYSSDGKTCDLKLTLKVTKASNYYNDFFVAWMNLADYSDYSGWSFYYPKYGTTGKATFYVTLKDVPVDYSVISFE